LLHTSSKYLYHRNVQALYHSGDHDDLKDLVNWTEMTLNPKPNQFGWVSGISKLPSQDWRSETTVTYFEQKPNVQATVTSFAQADYLEKALFEEIATPVQSGLVQERTLKLFLVEDLSTDVVELFGSRFGIDPLFFGSHYSGPMRLSLETPSKGSFEPMRLKATKRKRNWFQMENVRLLPKPMCHGLVRRQRENAPLQVVRNIERDSDRSEGGFTFELMRTQTSFWIDEDRHDRHTLVAVVLVDPTPRRITRDREPFRDEGISGLSTTSTPRLTLRSWWERIVRLTTEYLELQVSETQGGIDQMAIVYPAVMTVCAEWICLCRLFETLLEEVETVFNTASTPLSRVSQIEKSIAEATIWSGQLPKWRKMVTATLQDTLPMATRLMAQGLPPRQKKRNIDMTVELRSILRDLDEMQRRMDRLLDRGIAEMQLTASRQSLAESHDLARLTWLATIFIPLTFMSGLFSMNENIGSLKDSLRTYFSVAIPLAVVALLIARFGAAAIKSVILTWIVLLSVIPYSLSFKDLYRYWRQRRRGRI
jgi:hypothetical protein